MEFCKNCGTALKEGIKFCSQCGTTITPNIELIQNSKIRGEQSHTLNKTQKPLSPKTKKFVISTVILLAILFGAYKYGQYYYGKERLVNGLTEAIKTNDAKRLAKLVKSDDKKLEITTKNIKPFMELVKDKDYRSNLLDFVHKQESYYTKVENSNLEINDDKPIEEDLYLRKEGKKFGIFPHYQLVFKPQYIYLSTNYPDTVVKIGEKEVGHSFHEGKEIGPYIPGVYKSTANLNTDYIKLEDTQKIYLSNATNEPYEVYYELEGDDVEISTPFSDTTLYVNEKEKGVYEESSYYFGPVIYDGSISVFAKKKFPWGELQSTSQTIDDSDVYLDFYMPEEFVNQLMETYKAYLLSEKEALKSKDINKVVNASEYRLENLQSELDDMEFYEESYMSTLQSIKPYFDDESNTIWEEEGIYYASLYVNEKSKTAEYYSSDEPSPTLEDQDYTVTFIYDEDEKKWNVTSVDTYY